MAAASRTNLTLTLTLTPTLTLTLTLTLTKVAAASRTNKDRWARALLQEFGVPGCTERKLADLIPFQEIYTGNKVAHFKA